MSDRPRTPKERTIARLLTIVEKLRYATDHDLHGRGVGADNAIIDARDFGASTSMIYGPGCTYKTLADALAGHLYDLPSLRQYPQAYYRKELP